MRDRSIRATHRLRLSDERLGAGSAFGACGMRFLRNTDEWIGLLVLVSIGLFVAGALHAGLLSDWFRRD